MKSEKQLFLLVLAAYFHGQRISAVGGAPVAPDQTFDQAKEFLGAAERHGIDLNTLFDAEPAR